MFKILKKYSFGVDISDATIEIIELAGNLRDPQLEKYRIQLDEGIIKNGRLIKAEALAEVFKEKLELVQKNISPAKLTVNIPEEFCYLENFSLDHKDRAELELSIARIIRENIPVSFSELFYAYAVLEETKTPATPESGESWKSAGVISAAWREPLLEWHKFFSSLGFKSIVFAPGVLASFRAIFPAGAKRDLCLIDIGANFTDFCFFNPLGNTYSFTLKIGGRDLTGMLAASLGVGLTEAEELKKIDLSADPLRQAKVIAEEKAFFSKLINELKIHLKFCAAKLNFNIREAIILGGSSRLSGLLEELEKNLNGLKVSVGRFSNKFNDLEIEYASALGLALRGLDNKPDKHYPAISPTIKVKSHSAWLEPAEDVIFEYLKIYYKKIALILLAILIIISLAILSNTLFKRLGVSSQITKSAVVSENKQIIEVDLPAAILTADYSPKVVRARVIKASIKRAANDQMAINEAKRVATKNLLAGEKLWSEFLNKPGNGRPMKYPFDFEWLAYNEADVKRVALAAVKEQTAQGDAQAGNITIKNVIKENSNKAFIIRAEAEAITAKKINQGAKTNIWVENNYMKTIK
jgi:Tfp pilus assembly PilM family ATPase